jgi:hypothetical protein
MRRRIEARYSSLARQGRFISAHGIETWPNGTTRRATSSTTVSIRSWHTRASRPDAGMQLHQQIGVRRSAGMQRRRSRLPQSWRSILCAPAIPGEPCTISTRPPLTPYGEAPIRKRSVISHRGGSWSRLCQTRAAVANMSLCFLTKLGLAFVATKGQAHMDVQVSLARARVLCHQLSDRPGPFKCWVGCSRFMSFGQSSAPRAKWPISFSPWPSANPTPAPVTR